MPTSVITCVCSKAKTFRQWTTDDILTPVQDKALRSRLHHHACTKEPRCFPGTDNQMWDIIQTLSLEIWHDADYPQPPPDDPSKTQASPAPRAHRRLHSTKVDCSCGNGIRRYPCAAQQLTQDELRDASARYSDHQWHCGGHPQNGGAYTYPVDDPPVI